MGEGLEEILGSYKTELGVTDKEAEALEHLQARVLCCAGSGWAVLCCARLGWVTEWCYAVLGRAWLGCAVLYNTAWYFTLRAGSHTLAMQYCCLHFYCKFDMFALNGDG